LNEERFMSLLLALMVLAATPDAGASPVLKLDGALVKKSALTVKDLQALGAATVDFSDKKGAHKATGLRLDRLLATLGFFEDPKVDKPDPKLKHRELRAAVVATGADGYTAVFSVGEIQEELGATNVLVVWEVDGKPLPTELGPLRLLAITDKRQTRSLYQLVSLRLSEIAVK
jgi:DMSO/TMAO reductase YedYZ molybdopterin-dependent catalytic subunit